MKYRNKKTIIDGIVFDSKKEANRYRELVLLQKAGEIENLQRQVKYVLIPAQYENKWDRKSKQIVRGKCVERECAYIADFVYRENGQIVVEDTKGVKTKDYIIKRKLMLKVHGIQIREV